MADNINLLPQQSDENAQASRQHKLINKVSAIVLVAAIIGVVGTFAAKFVLDQQLNNLATQIQEQESRIQAKKTEEGIQQSLVSRIHALDEFLSTQNHYSRFLTELNRTFPESLGLTEMVVSAEKEVTLTGTVASYSDLAGFYGKLRQSGAAAGSDIGTDFLTPMLTTITRNDETGLVEFSLTFAIGPKLLLAEATTTGGTQ